MVIEKQAKETLQAQRQRVQLGHRHAGCCFNSCPNCQCLHRCPGSTEAGTARGGGWSADLGALKTRRSAGKGHTAEAVKRGGGPCLHETQQGPERCDSGGLAPQARGGTAMWLSEGGGEDIGAQAGSQVQARASDAVVRVEGLRTDKHRGLSFEGEQNGEQG